MDRQLRCVIAGETPARLAEGELAVAIVEAHLLRLDGDRLQRRLQAEVAEFLHRMRQQVDADAERPDFRHRLDHPAGDARAEEGSVGKEWVSTCRSRWSTYDSIKKEEMKQ